MNIWHWCKSGMSRVAETVVQTGAQTLYLFNPSNWSDVYDQSMPYLRNSLAVVTGNLYRIRFILTFGLRIAEFPFKAIGAFPNMVRHMTMPAPRQLLSNIATVVVQDGLPIYALSTAGNYIGSQAMDAGETEDENAFGWQNQAFWLALCALRLAVMVYKIRLRSRMDARNFLVSFQTSSLNENKKRIFTLCEAEKCSKTRFRASSIRDAITWFAAKTIIGLPYNFFLLVRVAIGLILRPGPLFNALVSVVNSLVSVFYWLELLLSVPLNGRYIVGSSMPEVCGRHQAVYFQQNPELVLSIGLTHAVLFSLIKQLLGSGSSVVASALEQYLQQLLIDLAIHMQLPDPQAKTNRWPLEPMALTLAGLGFGVDVGAHGLKKVIPRMLQRPGPKTDLLALAQKVGSLWESRPLWLLRHVFLHESLHSVSAARKDPLIKEHWSSLRKELIFICRLILIYRKSLFVRAASLKPKASGYTLDFFLGYPKPVVILGLKLIKTPGFKQLVVNLETYLKYNSDFPETGNVPYTDNSEMAPRISDIPEGSLEDWKKDTGKPRARKNKRLQMLKRAGFFPSREEQMKETEYLAELRENYTNPQEQEEEKMILADLKENPCYGS